MRAETIRSVFSGLAHCDEYFNGQIEGASGGGYFRTLAVQYQTDTLRVSANGEG